MSGLAEAVGMKPSCQSWRRRLAPAQRIMLPNTAPAGNGQINGLSLAEGHRNGNFACQN
jgi:hypothetical protein